MAESKVPFIINYRKTGTSPPIFIAGTFSDPAWHPTEMDHGIDGDGEHTFKAQVLVEPGKDYQFKIRIGEGDWWILSDNYATVTDDSGNQNNLLNVPQSPEDSKSGTTGTRSSSNTTTEEAQSLSTSQPEIRVPDTDNVGDENNLKTPLFAHECLGSYEFVEAGSDNEGEEKGSSTRSSRPKSKDYDVTEFDLNDPTLEKFPSDRSSILGTIRTIQTHLAEDQTHLDDIPSSPRVVSTRRTSIDSIDDHCLSPVALSPTTTRRRESRLSHSSAGRNKSAVSLGSIEEEPKPSAARNLKPPKIPPPEKHQPALTSQKRPPSVEDEGVDMTTSEVMSNDKIDKMSMAQNKSIEPSSDDSVVGSDLIRENGHLERSTKTEADNLALRAERSTPNISNKSSSRVSSIKQGSSADDRDAARRLSGDTPEKSAAKRPSVVMSFFRSLFNTLLGSKSNMIVTTGIAALAIGIGWWRVLDKQTIKSG